MSTNNFSYKNILVVLPDFNLYHSCDEDCEEDCKHIGECVDFDKFGYDEYISDMQSKLKKIGFESCNKYDNERNYSGQIIANWKVYDKNENTKVIDVVIRSGYYYGANMDYIVEDDGYYEETKTMEKKIASKIRVLEKVLRKNGTEARKVAQFSNGEAIYEKVKKSK